MRPAVPRTETGAMRRPHRTPARTRRPITALVRDIASNVGDLARVQMALARLEARESVTVRAQAATAVGFGAVCAILAFLFGCLAAAAALSLVLPAWAACLIIAFALCTASAASAALGRLRLRRSPLLGDTMRTLKEDAEWVTGRTSS